MSQKIYLVKYILEDDVPIDETSEILRSTYIPEDLIAWLDDNGCSCEIEIKETKGADPDIPVTVVGENKNDSLRSVTSHIDNQILLYVRETNEHVSDGVLIEKELDKDFKSLLIWLKIREILKEKETKYIETSNIKVVVG